MIGINPTVGCLILVEKASFISVEQAVQALQSVMPMSLSRPSEAGRVSGTAPIGGVMLEVMVAVQETSASVAMQLVFDEDEVIRIARTTGISLEQLFMPYVQAARSVPGVIAAGIGFELSPPADFQERSLQDAGIAVLFARDQEHKSWSRRESLPLVGHHL